MCILTRFQNTRGTDFPNHFYNLHFIVFICVLTTSKRKEICCPYLFKLKELSALRYFSVDAWAVIPETFIYVTSSLYHKLSAKRLSYSFLRPWHVQNKSTKVTHQCQGHTPVVQKFTLTSSLPNFYLHIKQHYNPSRGSKVMLTINMSSNTLYRLCVLN